MGIKRDIGLSLIAAGVLISTGLLGCGGEIRDFRQDEVLVQSQRAQQEYSTAANLMATAIKETQQLDIVLYPRDLVERTKSAVLNASMEKSAEQRLLSVYPDEVQDQFKLGTMKGEDIEDLIIGRSRESYRTEIDVAGLLYHIHFVGGYPQYTYFSRPDGLQFEKDQYYRVAISQFFFFNGQTFPGYKYRNGLNFSFRDQGKRISAKQALTDYLAQKRIWPDLKERRALVTRSELGRQGELSIAQIQGVSHRSPYYGQRVRTRGVVTAAGSVQWYPGGAEVIIQSLTPDDDPRTAEGLLIYSEDDLILPKIGDVVEVGGVVYEQITTNGLGMTSLRELDHFKVLSEGHPLPEPILLGEGGLAIPNEVISSWRGDLNLKPSLNLTDGIDFWESLEGMRVQIQSPRVVGFRGGQEDFESTKPKNYLTLYVRPDGHQKNPQESRARGLMTNILRKDYNPEIVQISTNHLTGPLNAEKIFNVGDLIPGPVTGVLIYQKNLFGDGEYNLVLPEISASVKEVFDRAPAKIFDLKDRPITQLQAGPDQLSIASMNLENMGGDQIRRLRKLGEAISLNLKCPDILNLVEIQDENGRSFWGGANADKTLDRLRSYLNCPGKNYRPINIDPVANAEGGQPGGNIRVAILYDAGKIDFTPRGEPSSLKDVVITADGHLSQNPGRVFPLDPVFKNSRRSLVTEFRFRGEPVFLIGNHFNSKLGDTSMWGAKQPYYLKSEDRRIQIAQRINDFVQYLSLQAPHANILVAGDFNAFGEEVSMRVLEGRVLKNLMFYPGLLPTDQRYTTNHNGNSQPLDYIFVNRTLLDRSPRFEAVHYNSDFMGRLSDHDPVLALFQF